MEQQKERLKDNRVTDVLEELRGHFKDNTEGTTGSAVWDCYQYIKNRSGQFDYKWALAEGLPIGFGEIESAHRYVVQERMKIAEAWWKRENAEKMWALREMRANDEWEVFWNKHVHSAV